MIHPSLSDAGRNLAQLLESVRTGRGHSNRRQGQKIHVAGAGGTISSAYEQLRNAAEYAEEHLLLQRAIRRFYVRNFSFQIKKVSPNVADELIVELTQAGYIKNDSVATDTSEEILSLVIALYDLYWQLIEAKVPAKQAQTWILDAMSIQTEQIINDPTPLMAFSHFAHSHFSQLVEPHLYEGADQIDYTNILYIAVQRALLKVDYANSRVALMRLYGIGSDHVEAFRTFNQKFDQLTEATFTKKITSFVSKNGAPLRIIKATFFDGDPKLDLNDRGKTLSLVERKINQQYKEVRSKLNRGVIKSIVFLFITKVLIGLAIEVPYDLLITGSIIVVPLLINLFFPIIYMAFTRITLKLPGKANTEAIKGYIDHMLYAGESEQGYKYLAASTTGAQRSVAFNVLYGLMFVIAFGWVSYELYHLGFNMLQGIIFFVFVSTASFLAFRLSLMVKELEQVTTYQGLLTTARDFLYTPFILVGQWLSEKYARINIVGLFLDMIIELPLKTLLRLIRQWTAFLNAKRDAIS